MADNTENAKALAAWDNWKTVCAINACPAESREILQKLLYAAVFGNSGRTGHLEKLGLSPETIESIHTRLEGGDDKESENLANIFDGYIKLAEGQANKPDEAAIVKPKAWKDFVWSKVNDPNNKYPKLQTIHSYLINSGEDNWYKCALFYILTNYLECDLGGRVTQNQNPATGKKYYEVIWDESKDAKNNKFVNELVHEDSFEMNDEDRQELKDNFNEGLSDLDCIFVLAELLDIPLYKSDALIYELNKGRSRLYDLRDDALAKLRAVELPDFFCKLTSEKQSEYFLDYLYNRLKANMPACLKICCQEALPIYRRKLEKLKERLSSAQKEETKDRILHSIFACEAIIRKLEGKNF